MNDLEEVFRRLALSKFRRRFRLQGRELAYVQTWGLPHVMKQAGEILRKRLAPAVIPNDGRQTPWRNHPVFVAQHATATCCRGCLEKTHGITKGHALTGEELAHALEAIERWLSSQLTRTIHEAIAEATGWRFSGSRDSPVVLGVVEKFDAAGVLLYECTRICADMQAVDTRPP